MMVAQSMALGTTRIGFAPSKTTQKINFIAPLRPKRVARSLAVVPQARSDPRLDPVRLLSRPRQRGPPHILRNIECKFSECWDSC